jgi:hypothetical protein
MLFPKPKSVGKDKNCGSDAIVGEDKDKYKSNYTNVENSKIN